MRLVVLLAVATLVLAGLLAWVVLRPRTAPTRRVDVVLVLGPSSPERIRQAEEMMTAGEGKALVVSSHPSDTLWQTPEPCKGGLAYPVYCFDPEPATTQGEARAVASLMRRHGWHSVQALTFRPHVERAHLILSRCVQGEVGMREVRQSYDAWYQLMYQSGGFLKAITHPAC